MNDPDLFDICARKHGGNKESVGANKKVGKAVQRNLILATMQSPSERLNWTCEELEEQLNLPHQSCSARISELKRDNLIIKIGTRPTRSGCQAAIYILNE